MKNKVNYNAQQLAVIKLSRDFVSKQSVNTVREWNSLRNQLKARIWAAYKSDDLIKLGIATMDGEGMIRKVVKFHRHAR